jgi:alpha-tubulin suppressor-like RCC1 family protein
MVSTLNSRGVRLVAAGGFSSAAIDEVKQVYTWGDGRNGQLGHGDFIDLTCPQIVKQPVDEDDETADHLGTFRARSIHLGPNYMLSMGLDAEQEKRADPQNADQLTKNAWGSNKHGTLGMPYLNSKRRKQGAEKVVPEKIPFLTFHNIKEIACGLEHVVAVVEVQSLTDEELRRRRAEGLDKDSDGPLERLLNDLKQLGDGELETRADPDAGRLSFAPMRSRTHAHTRARMHTRTGTQLHA